MIPRFQQHSISARRAIQARDWQGTARLAREIIKLDSRQAEGHFLLGIAEKAMQQGEAARKCFARALKLDSSRYDAAVELAHQHAASGQFGPAFQILQEHEESIGDSPLYLDMAASVYARVGKWAEAWPLLERADALQPGVERIVASMANCAVSLGKLDEARALYRRLLQRNPDHQQNHYQLARLSTAIDAGHIEEMQAIIDRNGLPPRGNIFLNYALGKELEDLQRWDESFSCYEQGGDAAAAASVGNYEVGQDIALIDTIIDVCDSQWFESQQSDAPSSPTPLFIVGLPRTGTTLLERIVSSHSQVESAGETLMIEQLLRGRTGWVGEIGPEHVRAAAKSDMRRFAQDYLDATSYLLSGAPLFIEKYTYNFLHLGLIAAAFPQAPIVHLRRHPMDACFAMYKQPYFRFAYTQEDLGRFYVAYRRLMDHWRQLLGPRLIEVDYESLVADQESETRRILDGLGLEFEQATLEFDRNAAPSATASSVQVREKVHTRSVGRWRQFASQLAPLEKFLLDNGIDL